MANCLKESWLLGHNLAALKSVTLQTAVGAEQSMQLLLVNVLLKRLGSLSVDENGRSGPKVVGQSTGLNADKVEVYAKVFLTFRIYMERLKQKYECVWDTCSMAWKLIRRQGVRGRGAELAHQPRDLDPVEGPQLGPGHERARRGGAGGAAREAAEQEAAAKQAALKQEAAVAEDQKKQALAKLEMARAAMETDPSSRTVGSRTDGPSSQQLEAKAFMQATSYLQLSCWNTISDSARAGEWRLWVIPPINSTQRGPAKLASGKSRCVRRFPWAADVHVQEAVVLCLGHDPSGMEKAQDFARRKYHLC